MKKCDYDVLLLTFIKSATTKVKWSISKLYDVKPAHILKVASLAKDVENIIYYDAECSKKKEIFRF